MGDREADDRWWPEGPVRIEDALHWLFERIDGPVDLAAVESPDPLPIATGIAGFDKACLGLRPGWVTIVESDLPAHAAAFARSVARTLEVPTLLAVDDLADAVIGLTASASRVPAVLFRERSLSDDDVHRAHHAASDLAQRHLALTDADSVHGLFHVLEDGLPDVLIVLDPNRLGARHHVIHELVRLALGADVAVLLVSVEKVWVSTADEVYVVPVAMCAHELAGRAVFVTSDEDDPLAVGHVRVDPLTGRVE